MIFDPVRLKTNGFNAEMLGYMLARRYDPERPMGNVAKGDLSDVVLTSLLGLHETVAPVIPRALKWIDKAIADDEDFGVDPSAHRATLHWAKAIGEWLLDGTNDGGAWYCARVHEEAKWRYDKRPWRMREVVRWGLDDYMAFAYQGGEHDEGSEAGIDVYEYWTGKRAPVSLKKLLTPREFAYALCLHRTGGQRFDEEELFAAGRRMLQARLESEWLVRGQILRAATWLKIVYWHRDESMSPLQVLLAAYENLQQVTRPDFVPMAR
ncbi:hypothetical protein ACQ4WP_08400 [Janthinobacterium sp. GB4P2]|uniref:hypothetical protein n=1 Tax=Janthinobacterium sp. GB4P2 TaxID=3424189 RepID=UPI003F1E95CD